MPSTPKEDLSGQSRLLSNVVTSWLSQLFTIITGFFLPRIIDQQLGQEILGIWDLSWSIVSYVSIAHLGIGTSMNRFVARFRATGDLDKLRTATSTVSLIQYCLATLVFIAVVAISIMLPVVYTDLGENIRFAQEIFFLLGSSIAVQFAFDTSRGVLTGCHRWDVHNVLHGGLLMVCSLLMLAAILLGFGLVVAASIYLVFILIEGIVRTIVASKICPSASFRIGASSLEFAREIFGFGIAAFTVAVVPVLIAQTVSVTIAAILGAGSLAVFARPNALLKFIRTIITKYTFVLTPMASSIANPQENEEVASLVLTNTKFSMALILPLVALFCLHGDQVITLWMGANYVNYSLILILGLGEVFAFGQNPILRVMIGLDLHRPIATFSLIYLVLVITGGVLLLANFSPTLEMFALATASTLGLLNGILIPVYSCFKLKIPVRRYLAQAILPITIMWGVMTLPFVVWSIYSQDGVGPMLLQGFSYAGLVCVVYWIRIVPGSVKNSVIRYTNKLTSRH